MAQKRIDTQHHNHCESKESIERRKTACEKIIFGLGKEGLHFVWVDTPQGSGVVCIECRAIYPDGIFITKPSIVERRFGLVMHNNTFKHRHANTFFASVNREEISNTNNNHYFFRLTNKNITIIQQISEDLRESESKTGETINNTAVKPQIFSQTESKVTAKHDLRKCFEIMHFIIKNDVAINKYPKMIELLDNNAINHVSSESITDIIDALNDTQLINDKKLLNSVHTKFSCMFDSQTLKNRPVFSIMFSISTKAKKRILYGGIFSLLKGINGDDTIYDMNDLLSMENKKDKDRIYLQYMKKLGIKPNSCVSYNIDGPNQSWIIERSKQDSTLWFWGNIHLVNLTHKHGVCESKYYPKYIGNVIDIDALIRGSHIYTNVWVYYLDISNEYHAKNEVPTKNLSRFLNDKVLLNKHGKNNYKKLSTLLQLKSFYEEKKLRKLNINIVNNGITFLTNLEHDLFAAVFDDYTVINEKAMKQLQSDIIIIPAMIDIVNKWIKNVTEYDNKGYKNCGELSKLKKQKESLLFRINGFDEDSDIDMNNEEKQYEFDELKNYKKVTVAGKPLPNKVSILKIKETNTVYEWNTNYNSIGQAKDAVAGLVNDCIGDIGSRTLGCIDIYFEKEKMLDLHRISMFTDPEQCIIWENDYELAKDTMIKSLKYFLSKKYVITNKGNEIVSEYNSMFPRIWESKDKRVDMSENMSKSKYICVFWRCIFDQHNICYLNIAVDGILCCNGNIIPNESGHKNRKLINTYKRTQSIIKEDKILRIKRNSPDANDKIKYDSYINKSVSTFLSKKKRRYKQNKVEKAKSWVNTMKNYV